MTMEGDNRYKLIVFALARAGRQTITRALQRVDIQLGTHVYPGRDGYVGGFWTSKRLERKSDLLFYQTRDPLKVYSSQLRRFNLNSWHLIKHETDGMPGCVEDWRHPYPRWECPVCQLRLLITLERRARWMDEKYEEIAKERPDAVFKYKLEDLRPESDVWRTILAKLGKMTRIGMPVIDAEQRGQSALGRRKPHKQFTWPELRAIDDVRADKIRAYAEAAGYEY